MVVSQVSDSKWYAPYPKEAWGERSLRVVGSEKLSLPLKSPVFIPILWFPVFLATLNLTLKYTKIPLTT